MALTEWAKLLKDDKLYKSFVSVVVPLLESWAVPMLQAKECDDSTAAQASSSSVVPKLGRKLRNKDAQTVSMYHLATTARSSVGTPDDRQTSPVLAVLDAEHLACYELVTVLAKVTSVEQILSKDALVSLAAEAKAVLEELQLSKYGTELLRRCNMKSIEKFQYSSGRQRTSKVRYVEYHPADGANDGAYDMSRVSGVSGSSSSSGGSRRNLHLSTDGLGQPAIIAWNKIRRPVEDPLITAAYKISATAGLLSRKLIEQPDDISCANEFYRDVLHNLDSFAPNGIIELQVKETFVGIFLSDLLISVWFILTFYCTLSYLICRIGSHNSCR